MNDSDLPLNPSSDSESEEPAPSDAAGPSAPKRDESKPQETAGTSGPEEGSDAAVDPSPVEGALAKPEGGKASKPAPVEDEEDSYEDPEERELGGRMTFLEHLDELRKRILRSVASVLVTFVGAWIFREEIYGFLARPITNVIEKLVVIKPTEPFTIYLKVSFAASIFLAAPFILGQVWMFIAPGLFRRERRYALPFLVFSTVLFVLGGMFAYYVVLPPALNFLLVEFGREFQPMITAIEFFDFELLIIIGMGVIFQLPVLVAFLSIFGMVTPRFLWRNFRYAFLLITILAAVVSPTTDPLNLFLWSGPMVILYTVSIGVSWIFQRKRVRREDSPDAS